MTTHTLTVMALGDREVVMRRTFDAPRALVFDAWTKPEIVTRWLGVRAGWTMPVCEIDLRVGGRYRWVWEHESGKKMGMGGEYREIVVPERIVATEKFDESWYRGGAVVTHVLTEDGAATVSTVTVRYETTEARDIVLASPMEQGVSEGYAALDAVLPEVARGAEGRETSS